MWRFQGASTASQNQDRVDAGIGIGKLVCISIVGPSPDSSVCQPCVELGIAVIAITISLLCAYEICGRDIQDLWVFGWYLAHLSTLFLLYFVENLRCASTPPLLTYLDVPENLSNKKSFIEMRVCGFEARDDTVEEFLHHCIQILYRYLNSTYQKSYPHHHHHPKVSTPHPHGLCLNDFSSCPSRNSHGESG